MRCHVKTYPFFPFNYITKNTVNILAVTEKIIHFLQFLSSCRSQSGAGLILFAVRMARWHVYEVTYMNNNFFRTCQYGYVGLLAIIARFG